MANSHEEIKEEVDILTPAPTESFTRTIQQYKYASQAILETRKSPRLKRNHDSINSQLEAGLSNPGTPSPSPSKRLRASSTTPKSSPLISASPNASKSQRRPSSKYAAPARYAHLNPLVDVLESNLLLVFVGVNPGISTAVAGHAYAHPSNRFWHLLHVSGLTPERKLLPSEDRDLPRLYSYGNTNIVSRPTKDQAELSRTEMVAGAGILDAKIRRAKPEAVVIVGKGIWEAIWRWRYGKPINNAIEFHYGWQDETENIGRGEDGDSNGEEDGAESNGGKGQPWKGARVFVATSTSGQAASMKPPEREAIWRPLGEWAQKRRAERARQVVE